MRFISVLFSLFLLTATADAGTVNCQTAGTCMGSSGQIVSDGLQINSSALGCTDVVNGFYNTSTGLGFCTNSTLRAFIRQSGGQFLYGTATGLTNFSGSVQPIITINGTSQNTGSAGIARYQAAVNGPGIYLAHSRGAAQGTYTIVSSGDEIGLIEFQGANGSNMDPGARIVAEVDGTPGASTDMPGRLTVLTTPDASVTPTAAMRWDSLQRTTFYGGIIKKTRVVTAAGAVTAATSDYIICVNKTTGAATTVNLFASPVTGTTLVIKDCKGDAATNNITITPASGNINGATTYVMNVNRQAATIFYDGTGWQVI